MKYDKNHYNHNGIHRHNKQLTGDIVIILFFYDAMQWARLFLAYLQNKLSFISDMEIQKKYSREQNVIWDIDFFRYQFSSHLLVSIGNNKTMMMMLLATVCKQKNMCKDVWKMIIKHNASCHTVKHTVSSTFLHPYAWVKYTRIERREDVLDSNFRSIIVIQRRALKQNWINCLKSNLCMSSYFAHFYISRKVLRLINFINITSCLHPAVHTYEKKS